ncbi:MAG: outer-membrane lipoprotein carrier protein LolA [Bryobacteraceae bacterium]
MSPFFAKRFSFLPSAAFLLASARAESLEDVLARMDRAAKDFKSMTAHIKKIDYTAVIDESAEQTGEVRLKGGKGGTVWLLDFQTPEPSTIRVDNKEARIFHPKAKTVEVYDIAKYTGTVSQLLTLGFATSGTELQKSYTIKMMGTETVDSQRATRLQLTPKSPEILKLFTSIDVWIPEGKSYAVQEKETEPSKNYHLVIYSDVKINQPVSDSEFKLTVPPGTKVVRPQS